MVSLGEKLRTTREGKGLSLDQVGLDTKLTIRYVEALESENFAQFPGEAYITGCIRNYGAYLGLDVEELLSMYRAIRIQEQPIPVEQLLKKPSVLPKIALAFAVVLLLLGIVGLSLHLVNRDATPPPPAPVPAEPIAPGDDLDPLLLPGDDADSDSADTGADVSAGIGAPPAFVAQPFSTVIFASPNPHPFTLQANFLGNGMFRWEVLAEPARRERDERFFQRMDEISIPNLHNGVRVWTSNAQAARLQVLGGGRIAPVDLGGPGEVVVADIRWVRGADNVFRLMVTRLEA